MSLPVEKEVRAALEPYEKRIRKVCHGKGVQKIERTLPRLEFGAKQNDGGLRRCTPALSHQLSVHVLRLRYPPIVIDRIGGHRDAFWGNSERKH